MIFASMFISGLGLSCLIFRKNLIGIIVGLQMFFMGGVSFLSLTGILTKNAEKTYVVAFLVLLALVSVLVIWFALCVRVYFLERSLEIKNLNRLKN